MDAHLDGLLDELVVAEPRERWNDVLVRARRRRPVAVSRRTFAFAVLAAVALTGGLATARAAGVISIFGAPPHRATIETASETLVGTNGEISTCSLIGERADQVAAALASRGIGIEWRFQDWGDVTDITSDGSADGDQQAAAANAHAAAVASSGGNSEAVSAVPGDSIVWSALPDDQTPDKAFVFAEAPNDPNAPKVTVTGCP
jgi:hypothetical protein